MKNKYLFLLLFMSFSTAVSAQDIIILLTKVEIKGNVTEITPDVIKYVVYDNAKTASNAMVLRSDVFMIRYKNGKTEIFNESQEQIEQKRLAEIEKARLAELEQKRLADLEQKRLADLDKARLAEIEKTRLAELDKARLAELDKVQLAESEQKRLAESDKARLAEYDRKAQFAETEKARLADVEKNRLAEIEKAKVESTRPTPQDRPSNRLVTPPKTDPSVSTPVKHFTGGFYAGGSLPLGIYAEQNIDDYSDGGGAKLGFTAGLNLGYRVNNALSLLVDGQFTAHPYAQRLTDVRYIYTLKGNWKHINVLPSVRFDVPLTPSNKVTFYAQAGAGVAFSTLDGDLLSAFDYAKIKTSSTHFAYAGSLGVGFQGINLCFKYVGGAPVFDNYRPLIAQIQATLGYQF